MSEAICLIEGCGSKVKYRGLCGKHYKRQWRHGDAEFSYLRDKKEIENSICKAEGCVNKIRMPATGYCQKHHLRFTRYRREHSIKNASGEGGLNNDGYYLITINGKRVYQHIHIAEKALGKPLPKGAVVHHVNGNPSDNRPQNLVICPDQAYHLMLHQLQRKANYPTQLSEFDLNEMED